MININAMINLFTELTSGVLFVRETALSQVNLLINQLLQNINRQDIPKEYSILRTNNWMISSNDIDSDDPFSTWEKDSVVILPVTGIMTKYSGIDWNSWRWVVGMDVIADLIKKADASPNITATILQFNTPGGTTQSTLHLEEALRNRIKPSFAVIDGNCQSAGVYVASFCDKIYAINRMCHFGSIGVCFNYIDDTKYMENNGFKYIEVYPDESEWKNRAFRELENGNDELIKKEELSPYAIHFQDIIKSNRPALNTEVEGILSGRDFFAYDAVNNGLIDGIKSLDQVIEEIQVVAKEKKQFYSQINSY